MFNVMQRKTTMLLYKIEESIGSFVLENGDIKSLNIGRLENIHQREVDKGRVFNRESIRDIVEATYLDELFGFALDIADDSSIVDSLNYLYALFHHLDIYEIRNAIAHPNRPFWDCYWYRVASIASDPVVDLLQLEGIKEALSAVENDNIIDPPDEWMNQTLWQIPNNLPDSFDHGVTGLIGRDKELKQLKKYIINPRVNSIALVAPGGLGKTALALDLLNTIVSTPSFSTDLDAVIFVTMKTEKLTASGVVSLDAIETIDELRVNIVSSINEAFNEDYTNLGDLLKDFQKKRILLCIDNLETLLRDNQDSFEDFNYELPALWKVLITSRITISNSTILSLSSLQEKSASKLARTYHMKRGGQALIQEDYKNIVIKCFYNPLAIRLSIDLIMTGKDIPMSLNVANKEIAEFSYNNLIASLSKESVKILEAIFVESESTRLSLCELLDFTIDEVSEAIGELSKTSLILRESTDTSESYRLSNSVRDLLLISPRNIEFRSQVIESINRRTNLANEIDLRQTQKDLPEWHTNYIPSTVNPNLKILVTELNKKISKCKKNPELAVELFKKFRQAEYLYEKEYVYHNSFGRVYEVLKDFKSAEFQYNLGLSSNPDSPSSYYLLARLHHSMNDFDKSRQLYEKLMEMGWIADEPSIHSFGRSIFVGYFLSLLYTGKYEEIMDKTKKWKDLGAYRSTLGTFRASAWKRKAEEFTDDSPQDTVDSLLRASRILSDVFRNDGYSRTACNQATNIFEQIGFCFTRQNYYEGFKDEGLELFDFVKDNIFEMKRANEIKNSDELLRKFISIPIKKNPFKDLDYHSNNNAMFDFTDDFTDSEDPNIIEVKIRKRPKDKATFLFGFDVNSKDYFLHFDNLEGGNWRDWCHLEIGQIITVLPEKTPAKGKSIVASKIFIDIN